MYYVYRFLSVEEEILYVGYTKNIKKRLNIHFTNGHLPSECYEKIKRIEYIEVQLKSEAIIYEIYYINKFKPKFNTRDKELHDLEIEFKDIDWKILDYDMSKNKHKDCFGNMCIEYLKEDLAFLEKNFDQILKDCIN